MNHRAFCLSLFIGAISFGLTLPLVVRKVVASRFDQSQTSILLSSRTSTSRELGDELFELLAMEPASDAADSAYKQPVTLFDQIRHRVDVSAERSTRQSFRILQFGDSHTAGDFFTDQLRISLKQRFGDAGIGWIQPFPVPGQRTALYTLKRSGRWTTHYQKSRASKLSLPIGGYSAWGSPGSRISVIPARPLPRVGKVQFSALVRSRQASLAQASFRVGPQPVMAKPVGKSWQLITGEFSPQNSRSFDFVVDRGTVEVAALFLDSDQNGVTVESIGRNSAELSWQQNWSIPSMKALFKDRPVDLIIFAYGTNEAVDTIGSQQYLSVLNSKIQRFKDILPQTPIVIVSVPSFAQYPNSSCRKPHSLLNIHAAQELFGQKVMGVSTWSWLQAMGGPCAVRNWANQGRMASDWIHFSAAGYRQSAILFERWLSQNQFN